MGAPPIPLWLPEDKLVGYTFRSLFPDDVLSKDYSFHEPSNEWMVDNEKDAAAIRAVFPNAKIVMFTPVQDS